MSKQDTIPNKSKLEKLFDFNKKSNKSLILHNDDFNSFDYVIESLIKVCDHNIEQAEQCTLIAHYKGKCEIKKGSYEKLKPFKDGLTDRGLKATIT